MKYIVSIQSIVMVNADTPEEANNQVSEIIEDVRKRNCGNLEDEILSNTTIIKTKKE